MVTDTQRRAAEDYRCETYDVSQRHASAVLGRARSTLRYQPRQRPDEDALVQAIRRLARRHRDA